ncbi:MAG: hypothetical protein ACO3D5_09140, partial [Ilumatobacteraceae bacterium]
SNFYINNNNDCGARNDGDSHNDTAAPSTSKDNNNSKHTTNFEFNFNFDFDFTHNHHRASTNNADSASLVTTVTPTNNDHKHSTEFEFNFKFDCVFNNNYSKNYSDASNLVATFASKNYNHFGTSNACHNTINFNNRSATNNHRGVANDDSPFDEGAK